METRSMKFQKLKLPGNEFNVEEKKSTRSSSGSEKSNEKSQDGRKQKAIIYCRVSSVKQTDGESLQVQEKICR